jgi:hypothetical protein
MLTFDKLVQFTTFRNAILFPNDRNHTENP